MQRIPRNIKSKIFTSQKTSPSINRDATSHTQGENLKYISQQQNSQNTNNKTRYSEAEIHFKESLMNKLNLYFEEQSKQISFVMEFIRKIVAKLM